MLVAKDLAVLGKNFPAIKTKGKHSLASRDLLLDIGIDFSDDSVDGVLHLSDLNILLIDFLFLLHCSLLKSFDAVVLLRDQDRTRDPC